MEQVKLTYLEKKLLDDVIRPALTRPKQDYLYGYETMSENLNFTYLLQALKSFYKDNGGKNWHEVLYSADLTN